jgi:hypothetical protein
MTFHKSVTLTVLIVMSSAVCGSGQSPPQNTSAADAIYGKVTKLSARHTRAEIRLKNNSKLKGYIGQISDKGFTVIDAKTGTRTPIAFDQVIDVRSANRNAKDAIFFAAGAGVIVVIFVTALSAKN